MKRVTPLLVPATALALILTGCGGDAGGQTGGGEIDRNATLRVAMHYPSYPMDPHTAASTQAAFPYTSLAYDTLTRMGEDMTLQPMVATEWEFAEDNKSVTFTLRDDVTFPDGTALDATAVKKSIDRALTLPNSTVAVFLTMIDSVEVLDPTHVRFNVNRPAADLPYVLSDVPGSIINPNALENDDLDVRPQGSGPYQVTSAQLGSTISFERRDGYWDSEAAPAAKIVMTPVTSNQTRMSAMAAGEYDLSLNKPDMVSELERLGGGVTTYTYDPVVEYGMYLNIDRPGLDDVRVRQALNYAVDREAINSSLLDGTCDPISQPLAAVYEGHMTDPPVEYTYDPEKAKALLREAGAENLTLTTVVGAEISPENQIAQALQGMFADAGVTMKIEAYSGTELYPRWASGTVDGFVNVKPTQPDGAMTLSTTYLNPGRFPGDPGPEFGELLAQAQDPLVADDKRIELLEQAASIPVKEAWDVTICALPTVVTANDRVVGADTMARSTFVGVPDLRYVGVTG